MFGSENLKSLSILDEDPSPLTLLKMEEVFSEVKHGLNLGEVFFAFAPTEESHTTKLLYSKKRGLYRLNLELTLYAGSSWTGPHCHPEFLVDEVLEGALLEQQIKRAERRYYPFRTLLRNKGDHRVRRDLDGQPHNVMAYGGTCLVLCLTLGKNPVLPIPVRCDAEGMVL